MEKTVKSEIFERTEYRIEAREDFLTISSGETGPFAEIRKIEVKGETKEPERALEIAQKYILDLEQGAGDYCDIAKAFKEVKEYTMDLDSGYGDVDVFLGELAQQAYNSFYEKVRTKVSADGGKSYLVLHEGNVECRIDDGLVRIEGERFALESGEYGLSAALSQISEVTDFLSEKSLETYEMLLEKFVVRQSLPTSLACKCSNFIEIPCPILRISSEFKKIHCPILRIGKQFYFKIVVLLLTH